MPLLWCVCLTSAFAAGPFGKSAPSFLLHGERQLNDLYVDHPFVALPGQTLFSPDPDQLRIQDLRGVDCYPQPDFVEVCGAADTTCILLFTKSQELVPEIALTVRFSEGLEYAGFVSVPTAEEAAFDSPFTDVDIISDQNPEAPSFLISGVVQDSGAVVVCFGISAECGVDLERNPPRVGYEWEFTTEAGVFCQGSFEPINPFTGNVITPRVRFTQTDNFPNNIVLGNINAPNACQTVRLTETTPGGSVTGYIFTAADYGFEEGVEIIRIETPDGEILPEAFDVDPVTGTLTVFVDRSADPLAFNEVEDIRFCFAYSECIANNDFFPVYTVVSACQGEVCTGPPVSAGNGGLFSNFPGPADVRLTYEEVQAPSVPGDQPLVFDLLFGTLGDTEGVDDLFDLRARVRSCASPLVYAAAIQLIDTDGVTVLGTFEPSASSVRNADAGRDLAGTLDVRLQRNNTVSGGGLEDLDGDGFFDDVAAGNQVRVRVTYEINCTSADASNVVSPAAGSSTTCNFRQVISNARSGCGAIGESDVENITNGANLTTTSVASFANEAENIERNVDGYNFGFIGTPGNGSAGPKTQTFEVDYTLADDPITRCPNDDPGSIVVQFIASGDPRLTEDFVFDNFVFVDENGTDVTVPAAAGSVEYPEEGTVLFTLQGPSGSGLIGQPLGFRFDITADTAYCSPRQIVVSNTLITKRCPTGSCDISVASTSTNLRLDPEDNNCSCYIEQFVESRRISRGFADTTRTTRVGPISFANDDARRALPGDTVEVVGRYHVLPEAASNSRYASELGIASRFLSFEIEFDPANTFNHSNKDKYESIVDYNSMRLQSIVHKRAGVETNVGEQISGPTQSYALTGLVLGSANQTVDQFFPADGEIFHPGLPNGGYIFPAGDDGSFDDRDGGRVYVQFRNDPSANGEVRALDRFNAITGGMMPSDCVIVTWHMVLVNNPGLVPAGSAIDPAPPQDLVISSRLNGSVYINETLNPSLNYFFGETGCPDIPSTIEYYVPQVVSESSIVYRDECTANARLVFRNSDDLPPGWYANEFRPINGIEQVVTDFPYPYFYRGGATVGAFGARAIPVFPDSTGGVDTATVAGIESYLPTGTTGQIRFTDAEFADSVRGRGYENIDFGDDDVTTIGGTFPVIAVGGTAVGAGAGRDSLVFDLPLRRICGDEPELTPPTLTAEYSYASRYLPDYEGYPWRVNTTNRSTDYWDGKVTNNNGVVVQPVAGFNGNGDENPALQFYFPFTRLPIADDDGSEINPHRRVDQSTTLDGVNQPTLLSASLSASPGGDLLDVDGPETQTITITPDGGQTLAGTIIITVTTGGTITGINSGGAELTAIQAGVTDTSTIFALPIPPGLAADEAYTFDLSTDLLFCENAEICVFPVLGCADDPGLTAAAYAAFEPSCQTLALCYQYLAGGAAIGTVFSDPQTLGLCAEQTLNVQFFNDGSSTVGNFSPIVYVPEGLDVSNFMFSVTGGATGPLTEPVADIDETQVFGLGLVFTQSEIDAAVGGDGFNPGEVLTISFTAVTSCDFTSGLPLVSLTRGAAACGIEVESPIMFSPNVNVALPEVQPLVVFDFGIGNDPLLLSCSTNPEVFTLTASNIGKAAASNGEVCLRLPAGIDFAFDEITAVAPDGYFFDEATVVETPIDGAGDRQVCFPAPELPAGGFVCLDIPVVIGDLECGEYFIGATLITNAEVVCQTTGEVCEIGVSTTRDLYFPIEVVAPVTAAEATLSAACTGTSGVFDVEYAYEFLAESQNFNGSVMISLFTDVDANGELDRTIDTQAGATQTTFVSLIRDEAVNFTGSFPGIGQSSICPLLLVIETTGCTCSEAVIPFPDVLPDFIFDLGESVALCPGETFTFEGICANLDYAFSPPSAGTVLVDDATGAATIALNPGFGLNSRIPLTISGTFGSCGIEREIGVSTIPDLDFGPFAYSICNTGSQEVDLNIPLTLQEDITVNIVDPVNIENPNSVEPRIRDLQQDMTYTVEFSFNDGECTGTSELVVTVEEAIEIEFNDITGCATGFNLSDRVAIVPANSTGTFQTSGDGTFTNLGVFPGDIDYTPGPLDLEAGFVNLRFNTDNPEGPCGPTSERIVATIQIVDCGSFFWDGSQD